MEKNLTNSGNERKSKAGRPSIYIDDVGETLSVQVPSKQKLNFRKVVLAMRKEYEIKK